MELAAGVTDVVLAGTCAAAAARGPRGAAAAGFVLVGFAAALGSARFLGVAALAPAHGAATELAALVGVPLVGVGTALAASRPDRMRLGWAAGAVFVALAVALRDVPAWRTAAGGGAMIVLAAVAARIAVGRPTAWLTAAGAVGVIVSGLVVAGPGAWLGMDRVAWFHLGLAASLGAIAAGSAPSRTIRTARV